MLSSGFSNNKQQFRSRHQNAGEICGNVVDARGHLYQRATPTDTGRHPGQTEMSTALDALLAIQGTFLLHGNEDGAAGVAPATALGDLRGGKAVVYGESVCSSA